MRLHNRVLVAVILSLAGFYSCSRQATIPTQLTYTPVPVFTIPDSLLATSPIEYAFYKAEPVEFFEPKPEVRDSFNRIEKTMVGYADDQFFVRQPELVLDLADLEEGAFVFPLPGGRVLSPYGRRNGRNHTGMDLKINRRHRSGSFRRNRQNDRLEPGLWQRSRRASLQRPGNGIRP